MKLFSTEQVSKYHPDKYADQISDAILDACLAEDKDSRVACECMVKGETVILCGEITTKAKVNYAAVAQRVGAKLGYKVSQVFTNITEQSGEIAGGVKKGKDLRAGDQGIMYGYACDQTPSMLPFGLDLANRIIQRIEEYAERRGSILIGDAKCQVTVDLDESDEDSVDKVLVSVCHKPGAGQIEISQLIKGMLHDLGIDTARTDIIINPAGEWTIGGPKADCGLTGRKIVCDQYGGYVPVGGGAFSGKDPSKVDRTAAYMARQIACDLLYKYDLKECEVQLAYAIGMASPMNVNVKPVPHGFSTEAERNAFGELLVDIVQTKYDLTPYGMIKHLHLLNTNFEKLAEGCHYRILDKEAAK